MSPTGFITGLFGSHGHKLKCVGDPLAWATGLPGISGVVAAGSLLLA